MTETLDIELTVETTDLRSGVDRGDESVVSDAVHAAIASGLVPPDIEESSGGGGVWQAIKHFLRGTRVQEGERRRIQMRWPLFLLGCPAAEGASTRVAYAHETSKSDAWRVKLFGTGPEQKTVVSITDTVAATAAPGQFRVLFVGYDVDVVELALLRGEQLISTGTRLQLNEGTGVVGLFDLSERPSWASSAADMLTLDFSRAARESQQEWSRQQDFATTYEVVLGYQGTPINIGAVTAYQVETSVTVAASLPGGKRWKLAAPAACAGFVVSEAAE